MSNDRSRTVVAPGYGSGMLRIATRLVLPLILVLAACQPPTVEIPPEAEVVHVSLTDESVRLEPPTVQAGDVYFVIEGPGTAFTLVRRLTAPGAEPTGMTREGIDRVARGDFQSTQLEGFEVSCAPDAWDPERHWQGCRENSMTTLTEGVYAILGPGGEEPGVPPVMDVLEVTP